MLAAREQLALRGPEVQMDTIAAAAGVAVGTLYRNFPAKSDLIAAVMREFAEARLTDLEATLARLQAGSTVAMKLRSPTVSPRSGLASVSCGQP